MHITQLRVKYSGAPRPPMVDIVFAPESSQAFPGALSWGTGRMARGLQGLCNKNSAPIRHFIRGFRSNPIREADIAEQGLTRRDLL
jgi:hypothetical protein